MYQYLNQKMDSLEQYFWCNLERFLEQYLDGDLVLNLDSNLGSDLERILDLDMD